MGCDHDDPDLGRYRRGEAARTALVADGEVISSLAGRVNSPNLPPGGVRVGGFGGAAGLADYLRRQQIAAVVDATHPFAATISANALQAANRTSTPLVRLERPGWRDTRGPAHGPGWPMACRTSRGRRCLPAVSHNRTAVAAGLSSLGRLGMCWSGWSIRRRPTAAALDLIMSRGPYSYAGERQILTARIDVLITKDSGGLTPWPSSTQRAISVSRW